jgi:hypothetical protein
MLRPAEQSADLEQLVERVPLKLDRGSSFDSAPAGRRSSMAEPKPPGKVLAGRDAGTPFRALNRVALVVAVAFLFVFAIAFTLWATLR